MPTLALHSKQSVPTPATDKNLGGLITMVSDAAMPRPADEVLEWD